MNPWVRKSIDLANRDDYLDKLHAVYPLRQPTFRTLDPKDIKAVARAFESKKPEELIRSLFQLDKFPYDDPYVSFLRNGPAAFLRNPKTVRRIGVWLSDLGLERVLALATQPKRGSRGYGNAFRDWLMALPFTRVDDDGFRGAFPPREVVVHSGSQQEWKRFADSDLNCGLTKNPDLLVKKGRQYVVGEAKFISDFGGAQNNAFDEAISLVQKTHGSTKRVAILDGVVWLATGNRICKEVRRQEFPVMSALLLKPFLDSL